MMGSDTDMGGAWERVPVSLKASISRTNFYFNGFLFILKVGLSCITYLRAISKSTQVLSRVTICLIFR